jgi:hypothetical protein
LYFLYIIVQFAGIFGNNCGYSARQAMRVKMGGFVGEITFEGYLSDRQSNTRILSFRLVRNLSLLSMYDAVRSPTSEDDGLRYFVAGLIEPFMPLIKAGEGLHVGKGTGFGLGRYEVKNGRI